MIKAVKACSRRHPCNGCNPQLYADRKKCPFRTAYKSAMTDNPLANMMAYFLTRRKRK